MTDWPEFVAQMHEQPDNVLLMGVAADYLEGLVVAYTGFVRVGT